MACQGGKHFACHHPSELRLPNLHGFCGRDVQLKNRGDLRSSSDPKKARLFGPSVMGRHSDCGDVAVVRSHADLRSIRNRLSSSAFTATSTVLPDMASAATSGRKTIGYRTPAASGKATAL